MEIYGQSPYTEYDVTNGVEKSAVELVGFAKTGVIKQGQSETVSVTVNKEQFASYDYKNAKTYILDAGDYYITLGENAHDAVNNILAAKGKGVSDGMTAAGNASLTYKWSNRSFDDTTYSTESTTGTKITNRFEPKPI